MVEHPVLFITFVRLDTSRMVWNQIKKAQPSKLYFYSNKGRTEKTGEIERNNKIREFIHEIDWECDLHTWFRDECVDVYTSLRGAKDWIFKSEETAIILEDDCMPSLAFFQYCDHFLDIYRDDKRINFISGNNYVTEFNYGNADHLVTRTFYHYGWAIWKDRWNKIEFDLNFSNVIESGKIREYYNNNFLLNWYYKRLYRKYLPFVVRTKCWDVVKTFNMFNNHTYCITPIRNLVQNVGVIGEHVKNGTGPQYEMGIPLDTEEYIFTGHSIPLDKECVYEIYDAKVFNRITFSGIRCYYFSRFKNIIKSLIKK